jgi:osmoprotectant transport system ATP-binding protein
MTTAAPPAEIELHDVRKSYDGNLALEVPALVVEPRRSLALIGPSGCGKSTLLRLVIGLVEPDQGRICVGGVTLNEATRRSIRLRTGYVIQEGGLFPHLTAAENITLVARDLGWPAGRIERRVGELLELTRIPRQLLPRYPVQLSGGQRQRIALMRALMLDPELVLMDEPLAALDPMIRSDLQRDLRAMFEGLAKTVLFVTHDLAEAAYVCDEMALMRAGRIVQRGRFVDLLQRPADPFVTGFIQAQRPLDPAAPGDA